MAPSDVNVIGSAAPDFEFTVLGASPAENYRGSLTKLRGSGALVIDFFAPWCKACPEPAKKLENMANGPLAADCKFLLLAVEGDEKGVREFASTHGIENCIFGITDNDDGPDKYSVRGLPHHVIISRDGKVAKNYNVDLPGDLEATLSRTGEQALAKAAAPVSRISAELRELEKTDPLLQENPQRFVMFPIHYPQVWEMYKKHEASFWTAEEIDLSQDAKDWDLLTENERHFVTHVLAFFAASDGIVLENLAGSFSTEV